MDATKLPVNKKCMICLNDYDDDARKPLMLSCGHSYCHMCLKSIQSSGNAKCPTCRRPWDEFPVEQLPLCYQLMPEELLPKSTTCQHHKNCTLLFWCKGCKLSGCKLCLSSSHRLCDWILIEDAPVMLKAALQEIVEKTKRTTLENHLKVRSAIVEITDTLHALKELMHMLTLVEGNLEKYKAELAALEGEISRDLSLISDKEFNSEINQGALSLTVLQTKINQADALPRQYIWPSKPKFHDLEKVVSDFQASKEVLDPNGDWKIRNHRMAKAAARLLRNPEVQPVQITVIVTKNWAPQSSGLVELLPLIASQKCDVRLRFMDTFLEPTEQTTKLDNRRLHAFNNSERRCHLKEFWGHLDRHGVKELSNYSVLEIKGVAILQSTELNTVCDVEWWNFSYVGDKERELHLHIPKTWTAADTVQLNQKVLEECSLHLHLSSLKENDVLNMGGVIQKWLKNATARRPRSLYLPASELSPTCISTSLLSMVYGPLYEFTRPAFSKVYIESDKVQAGCKKALTWMYASKSIDLTWTDV